MPALHVVLIVPLLSALLQDPVSRPAQPPPPDPRFGAAAEKEAEARLARIRDEVARSGAEPGWAGRYYQGDGLGANVTVELAPKSGFVSTWTGCMGVYDRNHGTVAEKDGRLELAHTFPNVREGMRGFAPVLLPVKWGERRYLIASDQLRAFANEVNGGSEPRAGAHGSCLLRWGDEARPAPGKPELPKEVTLLLLDKPLAGAIVAVHESKIETRGTITYRVTEATVGRGEEHGLWQGMILYFAEPAASSGQQGTVIELTDHTARIRIRAWDGEKAALPAVGWKWSTRAPWRR